MSDLPWEKIEKEMRNPKGPCVDRSGNYGAGELCLICGFPTTQENGGGKCFSLTVGGEDHWENRDWLVLYTRERTRAEAERG